VPPSPSPQLHLQSLEYVVDDRADRTVLDDPYEPGSEFAFVQVRERPTVIGTRLIDGAALFVEKAAGRALQHVPVPLLGQPEVLFDQLCFLNAEMIGEPPDIPGAQQGRDEAAAVRTGAAIDAGLDILDVSPDEVIEGDLRQVEALEVRPEAPVLLLFRPGDRSDPLYIGLDIHGYVLALPVVPGR